MLRALTRVLAFGIAAGAMFAKDAFLFTSFRSNGETGVFVAGSTDGKSWTPLLADQPWVKPEIPGMLMRDPWLGRGPDKIWHLLWTTGWKRGERSLTIGHTTSRDLKTWDRQVEIPVMENEPEARNAWAPEAAWNEARQEWVIFWASTIPGRFSQTESTGDSGYNHRIYSMTTKDWKTFTPTRLWFDPGFNCIDSTVIPDGKRWIMVFKDERKEPLKKQLRVAFAERPEGPWSRISEPFTNSWNEGPAVLKIGAEWWIYFDHYTKPQHYGAMRTRDWKTFQDATGDVHFPAGQRHGTAVQVPAESLEALQR